MARTLKSVRSAALALGVAALAGLVQPAAAHPHVWVTVETTVLFEGGSITGFRHKWTFDELYTAMAIQDLDTNKDGIYSREELAELAKVNIDGLQEFKFFTFARLGEQEIAVETAKDYWLEHVDPPVDPEAAAQPKQPMLPRASEQKEQAKPGFFARLWGLVFGPAKETAPDPAAGKVLSLQFTLPLKQPVLADAPDFSFAVYDPSFFIAFDLAKGEPVKLGHGAPAGCRIVLGSAEKTAGDAQRLGEAFATQLGDQNFGLLAAKPIKLQCGPRS